jgi:hypothetical protein
VILVNGVAEEVIHRAFIFGHLRETRSFWAAATISAVIFLQPSTSICVHDRGGCRYSFSGAGACRRLSFGFLYERGGNSLGAPAILHTSSNAPMMLFVCKSFRRDNPAAYGSRAGLHVSELAFRPWLRSEGTAAPGATPHANTSA